MFWKKIIKKKKRKAVLSNWKQEVLENHAWALIHIYPHPFTTGSGNGLLKCCCCLVCSGTVLFSNDQCSVPQLLFFSPVVITLGKTFLILHCLGWIVQQSRVKPMKLLNNSHMNFAQWPLLFQGLTLHYLKQNRGDEHCSAFILS